MAQGPTAPISPYSADLSQIERRKALAQALQAQSLQPLQTQMAGGWAVPINPLQGLAQLGQAYAGRKVGERATAETKALGQKYQSDYRTVVANALKKLQSGDAMGAMSDLAAHPQGEAFMPLVTQELTRQRLIAALRGQGGPGTEPAQAALAGGGGPTVENAQRMGQMQQMPQGQVGGPAMGIPPEVYLAGDPQEGFKQYINQLAEGQQAFGSVGFTGGPNPQAYVPTKGGGPRFLPGITPRDKLERADYGGFSQWENPYTGAPVGGPQAKTPTFADQAAQRRNQMEEERLWFDTGRRLPQPGIPPMTQQPPVGGMPPAPVPTSVTPHPPAQMPAPQKQSFFAPKPQAQITPIPQDQPLPPVPIEGGQYAGAPIGPGHTGYNQQMPGTTGRGMTPRAQAELAAEREKDRPKAIERVQQAQQVSSNVLSKVDDALKSTDWTTAGTVGWLARKVPGSPAYDLWAKVQTIKANIGFQELQKMRQMSPTGGALGQIAVQELEMLQNTVASLETAQSPAQLKQHLEDIKKHFSNWRTAVERSYTDLYGPIPQRRATDKPMPNAPAQAPANTGGWSIRKLP